MSVAYVIFLTFCGFVDGRIYRSIVWSPENPIFKESPLKCVLPKSMQYLLCPSLSLIVTDTDKQPIKENLYENIHLVDQQSYHDCKVNGGRLLKKCVTPLTPSRYDILFIDMHPLSKGVEFKFGKSYYFIATSNGTESSLNNNEGGHCKTHNMKLEFYVCKDDNDPYCQSEKNCQSRLEKPTVFDPVVHSPTFKQAQTTVPAPTSQEPTKECNTTKGMPTTSNESVPPYSGRYCTSFEVFYKLGISVLGLICVVFVSSTIFLAIRFYRFSKVHTDCRSKYSVKLCRDSNGSTNTDKDCSVLLNVEDKTKNV